MNDHPRSLLQHRWQESAIQADRREQIQIQLALPPLVRESGKPARRCGRSADVVNQDVDAAVSFENGAGDLANPIGGADIRLNVQI